MRKGPEKPQILLDWATVSYRSIMRAVVLVILLVSMGGLFFYLKATLRTTPEEMALEEIGRAERLYLEAQAAASEDPRQGLSLEKASRLLRSARDSLAAKEFAGARAAAQQSAVLSEKIIRGMTGEAFTAKVFKHEGDVKIKRARQFVWDSVQEDSALRIGDQIKTSSNGSAQIIYFDGTITTVKPGSLLEIRELFEDPTTKLRKVREKLNWGGVSASTTGENTKGSFHEVATEGATARAMAKAQFDVSYDAKTQRTRTAVHLGSAEVRAAGKKLTLNGLERVETTKEKVLKRQAIPATPRLLEPADNRVFLRDDSKPAVAALRWAEVKGARRYRLQISRTTMFGDRLLDKSDVRSTTVQIPGLQEGNYYWRVAAIDRKDIESGFSEARRFRVSGLSERRSRDQVPPMLEVSEFMPSGHMVIINGRTEAGAVLTVGGQSIDVYDDGRFTAVVRMKKEGRNQLEIVAQDLAGNETRMQRTVYVESF